MKYRKKYAITCFGKFQDKQLEQEFINYDMKRNAKAIGSCVLLFGIMYLLFLIADVFAIQNPVSLMIVTGIRVLFLIVSILTFVLLKNIKQMKNISYIISAYELFALLGFILITAQYQTVTLLLFSSVMLMTLAVFITPNKLVFSQLITVLLSLVFFLFQANHIEGIDSSLYFKIVSYDIIFILYCNIGAYFTNFYKRKQFTDSKELLKMSVTDSLTGIYNRTKFNDELNTWITSSKKHATPLSLVMLDIDDFKRVNDLYGHLVGDVILKNLTAMIKNSIRSTDIFARWGGEEFTILLPNTDLQRAMEIMEQMRIQIQDNNFYKAQNVTCSFGLVSLEENETAESLLQRVDQLLYDAKNCGKNIVVWEKSKAKT
jgi:diguanylate cyclase (GGDEF) domain